MLLNLLKPLPLLYQLAAGRAEKPALRSDGHAENQTSFSKFRLGGKILHIYWLGDG